MKLILAVIAGYLAMAVAVIALMFGLYAVLGTEGSFKPGSFEASDTWVFVSLVLGFIGALFGGWVCARIAGSAKASYWLTGLIVVLGIVLAIPSFGTHPVEVRSATLSGMDAMQKAYTPAWVAILNPIIGAVGVLITRRKSGG